MRVSLCAFTVALGMFIGFLMPIGISEGAEEEATIEPGFIYRDMEFTVLSPFQVLGTMINRTGRDYRSACFMMKLYSREDRLLKIVDFCVTDLAAGQSKIFRVDTYINPTGMKGYKIQFKQGL